MGDATVRRLLLAGAGAVFAGSFAAFALFERPGLGIGHLFYIAIALLALALGGRWGAAAGALATVLYVCGTLVNDRVVNADLLTTGAAIRAVAFVVIGSIVGWYATHYRDAMEELRVLAERDALTGLPNTRAFEAAITRRLGVGRPFALLVGGLAGLDAETPAGDDALRAVAEQLVAALGPSDDVARIGGAEFAVLAECRGTDEARRLAIRLERLLGGAQAVTFGWSTHPHEGENALTLYRAADERLYARRVVLGGAGRGVPALR